MTVVPIVRIEGGRRAGRVGIHWGDTCLEPDRTFTWLYSEQLPIAPQPLE